jgi:hypothetical protein
VWARDQRELFYLARAASGKVGMTAVDIAPGAGFKFGLPHQLFEGIYLNTAVLGNYDITPDGQHFIMERNVPPSEQHVTKLTACSTGSTS